MRRFHNSLFGRLMTGSAIPLLLFAIVGTISYVTAVAALAAMRSERHAYMVINQALTLFQQADVMHDALLAKGLPAVLDAPSYQRAQRRIAEILEELAALVKDDAQGERLRAIRTQALAVHPSLVDGDGAEAGRLFRDLGKTLEVFVRTERRLLAERTEVAETQIRYAFRIVVGAVLAAVILNFCLAWVAARSVTRPLERLHDAANQLSRGVVKNVPRDGPDEIADLVVLFNHMARTLTQRAELLTHQEERYRTYVGAVAHVLWNTDAAGQAVADLPSWRSFTGQEEAEVAGLGWLDAIHPEDRDRSRLAWLKAVESGSNFDIEFRLKKAGDGYCPCHCRAVPVANADGSIREWIGTCTDISEKKEHDALVQAKETAEAANRAKSEFLTRMSHELRTPLNAVIGMSKMLSTQRFGPLTVKQIDYIGDITRAGEHLLAMINDVLDLARVEAGKLETQADTFRVREAIQGLAGTLRPLAEAKPLTLALVPPEEDGEMRTDPARFRQVLYNLLSNAIKFTPPGGQVSIRWEWIDVPLLEGKRAPEATARAQRVVVKDSGVGIAPENHELIWEEFRQVKSASAEGQQGTGLGLALTRRLVALLGGTIGLKSAPGKGSEFTFVLPRKLPASVPSSDVLEVRPFALVIEDDKATSESLCEMLLGMGLTPVQAFDGIAGLEQARRLSPRVIVLDSRLPRLDGLQVLTALSCDPSTSRIPVLVVTMEEGQRFADSLDAQDLFVKPVDREAFLARLRELEPGLLHTGLAQKVLVVDDDPTARKLLGDLLVGEGFAVTAVENAAAAIERMKRERPDLVMVDLAMPDMNGYELVEVIRSHPALVDLPIIVVTGCDLNEADWQKLHGRVQALVEKRHLTPERLREHLRMTKRAT